MINSSKSLDHRATEKGCVTPKYKCSVCLSFYLQYCLEKQIFEDFGKFWEIFQIQRMISIRSLLQRTYQFYSVRLCSKKTDLNFIDGQYFATTEDLKLDKTIQEKLENRIEEELKPLDILDSHTEENFFDEYYFRGQIEGSSVVENLSKQALQKSE